MLNLRRLQALMLFFVVLIAGFLLFDTFFVQEATAQSGTTECDIAYARYKAVCGLATAVCNSSGWNSYQCYLAYLQCYDAMWDALEVCQN